MQERGRLPWRRVWVTGAGRGIGEALARYFCQSGVDVLASSRSVAELEHLQNELQQAPGKLLVAPLDICNAEQVNSYFSDWQAQEMLPDLVILNAGTHDPFPVEEFSAGRCQRLLEVNLQGTLNCLDPVLERFRQQGQGQIAVMASVAGYRGLPTAAAYGASKAALINLCEALRLDLSDSGVKLQLINPGFVRTPLTDKNDFHMPALISADTAATEIIRGLQSDRFEISFPWRFVFWLKLLRLLPYSWYFKLVTRLTRAQS